MASSVEPKAEVRIVELPPLRVASCLGFGPGPEGLAWAGLLEWMRAAGIPVAGSRFLGFNNPSPTPGNPNYGYEQWLVLEGDLRDAAPGGKVGIKDFAGGLYAVARHEGQPMGLPATWSSLALWAEASPYRRGSHQWLEEFLNPEILDVAGEPEWERSRIDIYLPIEA